MHSAITDVKARGNVS